MGWAVPKRSTSSWRRSAGSGPRPEQGETRPCLIALSGRVSAVCMERTAYMSEKRAGEQVPLSVAQRAIAHGYGFSSWPKLKAAVEARTTNLAERVDAFMRASVGGPERRAAPLLEVHP